MKYTKKRELRGVIRRAPHGARGLKSLAKGAMI